MLNYYEKLTNQIYQNGMTPREMVMMKNAEENGSIPMVAGPILCYIGKKGFSEKPTEFTDIISQRSRYSFIHMPGGHVLKNMWSIEEIKEYLENGHSIQNGEFREPYVFMGEKEHTFRGAQFEKANMIIVDIDDGNPSVEDLLSWAKPYRPSMIYHTLSHRPEKRKYRMLFLLNRLVDSTEYQMLTQYFINRVPGADQACKDPGRLYFGGNHVPFFEGNFLEVDEILEIPEVAMTRARIEQGGSKRIKRQKTGKEITETISVSESEITEKLERISGRYDVVQLERMKAYEFINNLPMDEIIGVNVGDTFRCILPDHHDNSPSASILEDNDGKQMYKCFGCSDRAINLIDVIQKITGKRLRETMEYILGTMGIEFDTKYRWEALRTIQMNRIIISQNQDSEIYKKLRNSNLLGTYIAMTNYMENYLPESPIEEGEISMFASMRKLSKTFKDWDIKGSDISRISRKMRDLSSYGLIEKIDHKDLPESLRVRSEMERVKHGVDYKVTYWRLPELTGELLEIALEKMKEEKGVGYTKEHLNRVQMLTTHGESETHKVYNQDELHYSEHVYREISHIASSLINRLGYFTKQMILDHSKYPRKKVMQYLPGIAKDMDLIYKSVNKELTQKLSLDLPRNSKIYIEK